MTQTGEPQPPRRQSVEDSSQAGLSTAAATLLNLMASRGGWHPDGLCAESGFTASEVSCALLELELADRVRSEFSGYHAVDANADTVARAADEERPGVEKKGRVLHTRVPEVLERELRRFADNLRIPLSTMVRTILEDAVNAADVTTGHVLKRRITPDPLAFVFAFQHVKLARSAVCVRCDRKLAAGENAHLALCDESDNKARIFVCDDCLLTTD